MELPTVQAGKRVKDPYGGVFETVQLPDLNAGTLLVFKTYDQLSYGLVMEATRAVHTLDKVRNPTPNLTAKPPSDEAGVEAEQAGKPRPVPGPRR